MGLGKLLKEEGYNLRERLNVYAGTAIGALVPIAMIRYGLLEKAEPKGITGEVLAWGISTLMSIPLMPYSLLGGCVTGIISSRDLKTKRIEKERNKLEGKLENEN